MILALRNHKQKTAKGKGQEVKSCDDADIVDRDGFESEIIAKIGSTYNPVLVLPHLARI